MNIKFLNREFATVHAAALLLGAAGLASRLLGVLRDRLLAARFGAGRELDIYYAAFQVPDFVATLFLLGAASAAIIPIFQEHTRRRVESGRELVSELTAIFLLAAAGIGVVAFFAAPFLIRFLVPGFNESEQALTLRLTRVMLLSPILLGLSGILSSVVQSYQRFLAYALSPIAYNIGIIIGIVFLVPRFGITGLALGVIAGAALHFLIQFSAAADLGFAPRLVRLRLSQGVRAVANLSFPRVLALSLSNLTLIVLVALGSLLAPGSIAVLQLAQNLYFVPVGIFALSYATAVFPRLTQAASERDARKFFENLFAGGRGILFWIIPSTALLIVLRAHIVRVALGAGAFSWEDTRLSAAALAALSIGLWAGALLPLLVKAFYAIKNTRLPLVVDAVGALLSVGLAYGFSRMLAGSSDAAQILRAAFRIADLPHAGPLGLALGYAIGLSATAAALMLIFGRSARRELGAGAPFEWKSVGVMIIGGFLAAGAAYGARVSFSETLPLISFAAVLAQGAIAAAAGLTAYFGFLYAAGSEEVRAVAGSLRRRFLRLGVLPQSWDGDAPRDI